MAELIYNIENLFSTQHSECCLVEYDVDKFHIAAYQRGYKWGSDEYGAVTMLLTDLRDAFLAFKNQERKEYYLQYITLMKNSNYRFLEVIDGQQRLTTLSILLSIISLKLNTENLAKDKLDYAIRTNFFNDHLYNRENLKSLFNNEWDNEMGLVFSDGSTINNQDVYFIFHAVKRIKEFCSTLANDSQLQPFYRFILNNVKVIVNSVEHISSEKVFSNLNSNKVLLTEAELIKGLLLTKISRQYDREEGKKHFREILEMRLSLGRQWDEMTKWSNQPEIKSFFFNKEEGMNSLLTLCAVSCGYKPSNKSGINDYPLFNFFHKYGKTINIYEQLIKIYSILKDWFLDDRIYNLLGFLFFVKGSDKDINGQLKHFDIPKTIFLASLTKEVRELIPANPEQLFYANNQDNEIHRALLAINVFSHGPVQRFNFYRFMEEKWTLEHIFPQTPEGKGQKLKEKDKKLIIEMLGISATDEIKKILEKEERTLEEKEIYQNGLAGLSSLNSIGNMCLLTDKDNISNGCGFFDEKRTNILDRIRKGSFVPKHTFDIFSKMVFDKDPGDFERWTNENIKNHTTIIKVNISSLELK